MISTGSRCTSSSYTSSSMDNLDTNIRFRATTHKHFTLHNWEQLMGICNLSTTTIRCNPVTKYRLLCLLHPFSILASKFQFIRFLLLNPTKHWELTTRPSLILMFKLINLINDHMKQPVTSGPLSLNTSFSIS